MPTPEQVLRDAADIVSARGETHGDWRLNITNTAELWSHLLHRKITPAEVCMMMIMLKCSRAVWGSPTPEHFKDICGYGAIAAALISDEETETD
tara:strand:+ start:349 stop:630 length:282 start_codon:yes stop_codon:yes gene_type:complete